MPAFPTHRGSTLEGHPLQTRTAGAEAATVAAAEARHGTKRRPREAKTLGRYSGPPMTLGNAAAASVRLLVWCLDCGHRSEPDAAEMAERYGAEMTIPDWRARLVCGQCGSRSVDMVISGTERR